MLKFGRTSKQCMSSGTDTLPVCRNRHYTQSLAGVFTVHSLANQLAGKWKRQHPHMDGHEQFS